ncbi:ABC transporter permease [Micropruina sp.]|uniref:ABC transporter permease n=1 Tax=Micropruina sp. TaxID=2737536 RepID=UPI0039E57CEC
MSAASPASTPAGRQGRWWSGLRDRLRPLWVVAADAGASLLARPWHAIGMMSGILLGVASATAAVVIADTQQAQIDLRFDLQRSQHVVLWSQAQAPDGFPPDRVHQVTALEPVSAAGEFSLWSTRTNVTRSFASHPVSAPVIVADAGGLAASETTVLSGAAPQLLTAGRLPLAWVGRQLAADLGVRPADGTANTPDAQVVLDGRPFSVAGIVANATGFDYVDNSVVIPREAAGELPSDGAANIRLLIHVRPGSAAAVAAYALAAMDYDHTLQLRDVTPPDGQQLLGNVTDDLRRIGAALGGFIGLVGMVAIANTLMLAVNNRRRELGLRSAMGWSRRRIGVLILTESAFAGLIAGLIGAAVGLAAAAIWCAQQGWTLIVWPPLPWLVALGGVAASLFGGLIPALRAATVTPLTAMQAA